MLCALCPVCCIAQFGVLRVLCAVCCITKCSVCYVLCAVSLSAVCAVLGAGGGAHDSLLLTTNGTTYGRQGQIRSRMRGRMKDK